MPQAQAAHDNSNQTQDNKRHEETPGARGFGRLALVLFTLFLCVLSAGFALLYYGLNEPSKVTQFWAPNILNALLLAKHQPRISGRGGG